MTFIYLALVGFVVGLVARILMPGRDPMGIIMTTLLGIIGSYAGAMGSQYLGVTINGSWQHFAVAVAGSFLVLGVYKFIRNV